MYVYIYTYIYAHILYTYATSGLTASSLFFCTYIHILTHSHTHMTYAYAHIHTHTHDEPQGVEYGQIGGLSADQFHVVAGPDARNVDNLGTPLDQ